jgi:hypothetical protein
LDEFTITGNKFYEILILRRVFEGRNLLLTGWLVFFNALFLVGLLALLCRNCTHQETGRVAVSEILAELLEIEEVISSDINMLKQFFDDREFRE